MHYGNIESTSGKGQCYSDPNTADYMGKVMAALQDQT